MDPSLDRGPSVGCNLNRSTGECRSELRSSVLKRIILTLVQVQIMTDVTIGGFTYSTKKAFQRAGESTLYVAKRINDEHNSYVVKVGNIRQSDAEARILQEFIGAVISGIVPCLYVGKVGSCPCIVMVSLMRRSILLLLAKHTSR